jgi:hypothetical protein
VTKTVAGSVVLGNGSAATTGAGVAGYALSTATTADKTAISNTTSTTGAVAVGDAAMVFIVKSQVLQLVAQMLML